MDVDLAGRTSLTAAASGIGLAAGRGLARQVAAVWINGRDEARLDAARASILEAAWARRPARWWPTLTS